MSTISAGTSTGTALVNAGDTTGTLVFQTNGSTTALTLGTDQNAAFNGAYTEKVYSDNSSTAITLALTNGTVQIITLTGNCTYTFPTPVAGKSFFLVQKQDGTGSRTVTWPASVKWPAGTAPTITSTASRADKFVFTAIDGSSWLGSVAGQNYTV